MVTHSSILPGKFHGQRSLVGYSPWGQKESDTTKQLGTHRGGGREGSEHRLEKSNRRDASGDGNVQCLDCSVQFSRSVVSEYL